MGMTRLKNDRNRTRSTQRPAPVIYEIIEDSVVKYVKVCILRLVSRAGLNMRHKGSFHIQGVF